MVKDRGSTSTPSSRTRPAGRSADESVTSGLARLPETLEEAYECAAESELVKRVLPGKLSKTLA